MIIRRLRLRDFRRHAATEMEFGEGVLGLLGPNGAGKSSVLEAIGYALWGAQALRTSAHLVRREGSAPTDVVEVELELELDGARLRVQRELRGKDARPSATLEVDGHLLVPSGAGSDAAATRELERRLGLDDKAFFTTLVARQKELARLAQASGPDRKRLILDLAGVARVDAAIDEARASRNRLASSLDAVRAVLADPARLAAEERQAADVLEAAKAALAQAIGVQADCDANAAIANKAWVVAQAQKRQHDAALLAVEAARRQESAARQRALAAAQSRDQAEAAAEEAARLAGAPARHTAARDALQQARLAQQASVAHAREVAMLARLESELAQVRRERATIVVPAEAAAPPPESEDALRAELASLQHRVATLELSVAEHAARHAELERLGHRAECPTCGQSLNGHLERVRGDVAAAAHRDAAAVAALRLQLPAQQAQLVALQSARVQAASLARRRVEAIAAATSLDSRIQHLSAEVAARKQDLGPAPAHVATAALEAEQRAAEADERQFLVATTRAGGLAAAQAAALAAAGEADLFARQATEAQADAARFDAAAYKAADAANQAAVKAAHDAREAAHRAREACAVGAARVEHARTRRQADAEQRAAADLLAADLRVAALLADGKQGLLERFRDHLVARLGPLVAAEASRLMAAFTGGRYSEVQLDGNYQLYLVDDGRAFELERFSGGEQDLAHLAVRLAVSRLLCERSGADIRFLALDEVFGSLDRQRRDLVIEAIRGLGNLYAQVLLVSHLDGLEEALDAAYVVASADGIAQVTLQKG